MSRPRTTYEPGQIYHQQSRTYFCGPEDDPGLKATGARGRDQATERKRRSGRRRSKRWRKRSNRRGTGRSEAQGESEVCRVQSKARTLSLYHSKLCYRVETAGRKPDANLDGDLRLTQPRTGFGASPRCTADSGDLYEFREAIERIMTGQIDRQP